MAHTFEDMQREAHEWLKGLDPATIETWLKKHRRDH